MIRLLALFVLAAATVAVAGWFAADPGSLAFTFQGWRVETSVGVAALAVVLTVVAAVVLYALIAGLVRAPARARARHAARRRKRGLKALAAGMVAVAAGDARGARRAAARAEAAAAETPLTLLLAAQAAQLEGDDRAAEKYFTTMLVRPETEFLALRGLIVQAARAGNDAGALAYARRAARLRPDAGWAHAAEFELAVKSGAWTDAEAALERAVKRGAIARERGHRYRAALLLMESRDAEQAGFPEEALALAKRADRAAPEFAPAALARARLDRAQGNARRARRQLERAFGRNPHPEIAAALLAFAEADGVAAQGAGGETEMHTRLRIAQRLLEIAPAAPESHLAAAEAALDAHIWGRARRHLDDAEARIAERAGTAAGEAPVPARLYRLRARLEEAEHGDSRSAGHWLYRAAAALPDPRWVCGACGTTAPHWTGLCGHCRGFDTYDWRSPAPVAVLGAESPVLAALAAPAGPAPDPTPPAARPIAD